MKDISVREFALLCKDDPALFSQVIAIPNTVSVEKLLDLAAKNGYRIVPEQSEGVVELSQAELGDVTGGLAIPMKQLEEQEIWRVWFCTWTGLGDPGRQ